jgi:hypothetical protein
MVAVMGTSVANREADGSTMVAGIVAQGLGEGTGHGTAVVAWFELQAVRSLAVAVLNEAAWLLR